MDSSSPSDFEEMMAALGLLTSRFNWLETEFKLALIKLLNCSNQNVAYAVVEEWRGFEKLITLVDKLFRIYNSDPESRKQLSKIIKDAKHLCKERNKYVHSIWFERLDPQKSVARMKGRLREELSPVAIIEVAGKMADCLTALKSLMTQSLPIDKREE
jgi:hypothetical protein